MSDIRVHIDPLGDARLSVGGVAVEHVGSIAISSIPGELSRLWVELIAPDGIEVDLDPSLIFYGYNFEEEI
jgi:hypothetical protein